MEIGLGQLAQGALDPTEIVFDRAGCQGHRVLHLGLGLAAFERLGQIVTQKFGQALPISHSGLFENVDRMGQIRRRLLEIARDLRQARGHVLGALIDGGVRANRHVEKDTAERVDENIGTPGVFLGFLELEQLERNPLFEQPGVGAIFLAQSFLIHRGDLFLQLAQHLDAFFPRGRARSSSLRGAPSL